MDDYQPNTTPDSVPPPPPSGTFPPGGPPPFAPPAPEEMGTAKVVGLSALACCIPLVGPLISLIIGIIDRAKHGAVVVIALSAVMLLLSVPILGLYAAISVPLFLLAAPESVQEKFLENALGDDYSRIKNKSKEAEGKQNLHLIQLALERYSIDHDGDYPDNIEQLLKSGFIDVLPDNPFAMSPMQEVLMTDPPEVKQGNFSYLKNSTAGIITGYTLLGYGAISTIESHYPEGSGPAAVVIYLEGGTGTLGGDSEPPVSP